MKNTYTGISLYSFVILCVLFSSTTAFAGGFETKGLGSRQLSMGGATLGLADDWSALYWNPAGLAYLRGSEIILEAHTMLIHQESNVSLRNLDLYNQACCQDFVQWRSHWRT